MRQVVVLTVVSFLIFASATNARKGELPGEKQLIAWGMLFVALLILSDFEQTETFAAAMAWLITLTIFLGYGTDFFAAAMKAIGEGVE